MDDNESDGALAPDKMTVNEIGAMFAEIADVPWERAVFDATVSIVQSFAPPLVSANGALGIDAICNAIASVHKALSAVVFTGEDGIEAKPAEPLVPAVPIKKSITDDHIISLEDGKPYKALKRHLTGLGLTPATYREKWGLPADYPMVAPSYSRQRTELAKSMGLGRKPGLAKAA